MNRVLPTRILFAVVALLIAGTAMAYPSDRRNPAMAWSDEAQGVILFGGLTPEDAAKLRYAYDDTWKWDGVSWVRLRPEVSPTARFGSVMVYDDNRDRLVLFGGSDGTNHFNDTWAFSGGEWSNIAEGGPEPRRFAAGAFDPAADKFILYGGFEKSETYFNTWEFDGTSWVEILDEGPKLNAVSMAYDEARGEVIMLGRDDTFQNRTYRYDGSAWTLIETEGIPPCVSQAKMVFRDVTQTLLTYGGGCIVGGSSALTYQWDGTDWSELEGARQIGTRQSYGLAYDELRDEVVLYGGTTDISEIGTTWLLKNDTWRRVNYLDNPGPRTMFVFSQNLEQDGVLLFGGQSASTFFQDLWNHDSGIWQKVVSPGAPNRCSTPVGGTDTSRGLLVVFCADGSTYDWDGAEWTEDEGTVPSGRSFAMMTWMPTINKMVLYGGFQGFSYTDDTWTYDGNGWTELKIGDSDTPDARILAQMFFDPNSNRLIVFGGIGRKDENSTFQRYKDQWSFNGTKWTEMKPSLLPPQRYGAQVAWDPSTERILMFGGKGETEQYLNDMWAWDGSNWSEVEDLNPPLPRMNGRMVWDPESESVLLYGGFAGVYYPELWRFEDGQWTLLRETSAKRRRSAVR